jgi:acylphosphatase
MPLHVVIRGRVQGVGFRWFVREQGRLLGVRGWVKNRPDGSVEVTADGDAAALEALRARLASGPPGADVTELQELEEPAEPLPSALSAFTILR